jgi:Holliday junction resolvase RusA-like endonuclease
MVFTVFTKPVGQMRARACIRGKHASTYKARDQEQREQTLAALLAPYAPGTPMEGPLRLHINATFAIPHSKSKAWQQAALIGDIRHISKPDADNIAKHIKDVMTGLGFWGDDKQVADLVVRKWYGTRDELRIRVEPAKVEPLGFWQDDDPFTKPVVTL